MRAAFVWFGINYASNALRLLEVRFEGFSGPL
jgi:hypothetical protein